MILRKKLTTESSIPLESRDYVILQNAEHRLVAASAVESENKILLFCSKTERLLGEQMVVVESLLVHQLIR